MFADDKIGIGYGLMGLLQDDAKFVTFNGQAWILDETALTKHLKAISTAGANFVRLLPWGVWGTHKYGKKSQFQPYFLDTARDKWDLSAFNTHYFPILKRVIEIINSLNMTVMFCLFDNCQFHKDKKNSPQWSPFVLNTQGITTLYDPAADVYTKRWVSTMTLRFKDADIIWAFGNELENQAAPAFIKRVIFPYIKLRKLDFNRMTYGATTKIVAGDSVQDQVRLLVRSSFGDSGPVIEKKIIMEDHGFPFSASLPVWGNKAWRKLYSDDGCYTGHSTCDKNSKGSRPSAVEWQAKAKYILDHYPVSKSGIDRLISFEHLTAVYPPDTACQTATVKAISMAYRAKFGVWPKNYGKHP